MAKLREKMETRQFLRLVAEARRRYAIDPLTECSTREVPDSAEEPNAAPASVEQPAAHIAGADEPPQPEAPQTSADGDEASPEPCAPTLRREESA